VEISTSLGPGEWSEETLPHVLDGYRDKLIEMGASADSLITTVDRAGNGSIAVSVRWDRHRAVPAIVQDTGLAGPGNSHGLDGIPLGNSGGPVVNQPFGSEPGQPPTPGLSDEKVIMYTDDEGTTWLE
jgi:hypothetical protein